jgi:hypothetical protein
VEDLIGKPRRGRVTRAFAVLLIVLLIAMALPRIDHVGGDWSWAIIGMIFVSISSGARAASQQRKLGGRVALQAAALLASAAATATVIGLAVGLSMGFGAEPGHSAAEAIFRPLPLPTEGPGLVLFGAVAMGFVVLVYWLAKRIDARKIEAEKGPHPR